MHSPNVALVLLKADLDKSIFPTHSFEILVFHLFCFEFDVIFVVFFNNICVIIVYIGTKFFVIFFLSKGF